MNQQFEHRRNFLKISMASYFIGISDFAFAKEKTGSSTSTFIFIIISRSNASFYRCIFKRGGADGLSILSPLLDENFQAARPPEMRFSVEAE
jgi:uncharacterized protein (DUF1501 family)